VKKILKLAKEIAVCYVVIISGTFVAGGLIVVLFG